ncbi:flavin monoamine oxidase family protein [Archangium primigenium]|uniref:flavin monoamine oxidase family protein n=1 Tax=[Archangium] primigenium TaxID=2792470 RepID=UPI00195B13E1|nr:FAD-dependent oxidoreductase [Archangium primigenium]
MPIPMRFDHPEIMETRVAVVGGGVSGIYSAWRLKLDGKGGDFNDVKVFEFGNRVGGRLETLHLDNISERRAEVGGMRFIPDWQLHISSLIQRLRSPRHPLDVIDFPMGDDRNLYYLRARRFEKKDFNVVATRYDMKASEIGVSPDDYFVSILNTLLADCGKQIKKETKDGQVTYIGLTRQEWDEVKQDPRFQFGHKPVVEQGFWNILAELLSPEAYQLVTDAGGYHTLTANWNAAEAASFIGLDFIGAQYKTLQQGYDAHVAAMAQEFTDQGGEIWGHSELIRFERVQQGQAETDRYAGKLKLTFQDRGRSEGTRTFIVYADKLILAMPRHGLERLELFGTDFDFEHPKNRRQRMLLNSVMTMPAFKLFMGFERAWWEKLDLSSGRSISDLPLRQTYYFGSDPSDGHALLMTSYNDAGTVSFWKGLKDPTQSARYISHNTVAEKNETPDTHEATPAMLAHAKAQLAAVHDLAPHEVPEPIASAYKDWSDEPFGAGWYLWKPGVRTWEVMKEIRNPWPDVHVCGDCYSSLQGWVEGALNTAERMLEEHFGMERPKWLDPRAYLGF